MTVLERRQREFQQRESHILTAAIALFNRDDWQTVTIDQIAAKAEIGKGTVYKHFESKDEIYAKLVVEFHRGILREIRKIDLTQPPLKVIGSAMDVFWRAHASSPENKRLIRYCRREDFRHVIGAKLSGELDELDAEFASLLDPVIERGIREGEIVRKPIECIILGLHAALIGVVEMEGLDCLETRLTPEQQYKEVREFALRGIAKR
jgi:AcrR family transcriptional regulator